MHMYMLKFASIWYWPEHAICIYFFMIKLDLVLIIEYE